MIDPNDTADVIFLRDHVREVEIGAFTEERGTTQRLRFSVEVQVCPPEDLGDDVDKIMSYDRILEAIDSELSERRMDLLETLAEGVASRLLTHDASLSTRVVIEKLDRVSGTLGVEILRSGRARAETHPSKGDVDLVYLAHGASVEVANAAQIIVAEGAPIETGHDAETALRLALLASEAQAWRLGGHAVVHSRTELDHSVQSGLTVYWAPAKMVFDAAEGLAALPHDLAGLALWLAQTLDARSVTFVGARPPEVHGYAGEVREHPPA